MRHVLITGCRGFIGRHLAKRLSDSGDHVVGIGYGAWPQHEREAWGVRDWCDADVTRESLEDLATRHARFDAVFHLAGGSAVAPSIAMPAEDFRRSVGSTLEVLEWCRARTRRPSVVLASTAAVYGDGYRRPVRVSDPVQPKSPYGHHKWMSEQLMRSYAESFGVPATVVRLFSVYGPGLRKQMLWDTCRRLHEMTGPLSLAGTGEECRDWLHVSDAVRILRRAAGDASPQCPVIHGATGVPITVREVADALHEAFGRTGAAVFTGVVRTGDVQYGVSSADEVRDFGPFRPFSQGLAEYVEWFRRESGPMAS
jgi:UDP-glucose 4-epimerase